MSFRKKILYKISPTYRNTAIFRDRTAKILDQLEDVATAIAVLNAKVENSASAKERLFSGHYEYWRAKRIVAIVEEYGEGWFKGKKILELGCGYGDIGYVLSTLGAEVVYAEGRKEHCDYLRERFSDSRVYQVNLENEWPFAKDEKFDMILHLGLLYHLQDYHFSLKKCSEHTDNLVLETEVCDSDEDFVLRIEENKDQYDQSLIAAGSRPSALHVENILSAYGYKNITRIRDARCNANFHTYDWNVTNTRDWKSGMRRFWFVKN